MWTGKGRDMSQLSIDSFEHDKLGLQPFAQRLEGQPKDISLTRN